MKKQIENREEIVLFLESLKDQIITEEETLQFKKDLTEVVFKPRSKRKKNDFCKLMDMELFDMILKDLQMPYRIREISEESGNYYTVKNKEENK